MKILSTAPPGSPEWKEAHKGKIGGSAAVNIICGADPKLRTFGTPLQEFMRLTGRLVDEDEYRDDETVKLLEWGRDSEPLHRLMLQRDMMRTLGRRIDIDRSPGLVQSEQYPWMAVTVDGVVHDPELGAATLETKAPSRFTAHEWDLGAPRTVMVQARAGGIVLGIARAVGSALVSGLLCPEVHWQLFEPMPEFDDFLVNELGTFYDQFVHKDTPPPPTWKPLDRWLLGELHKGKESPAPIELPAELEDVFVHRQIAKRQLDDIKRIFDQDTNTILAAMGAHETGTCGVHKVSYKRVFVKARHQDAYDYRNPRITSPGGE